MAVQPERTPPGYTYDNTVCFVERALVAHRVLNLGIAHRDYAHPVRCVAERVLAYVDGSWHCSMLSPPGSCALANRSPMRSVARNMEGQIPSPSVVRDHEDV